MAVTPIGSQIFTNQMSPVVSQLNQATFQRFDLQSFMTAEAFNEKKEQLQAISEPEEGHKIDAKNENGSGTNWGEPDKREKKESNEEEEPQHSGEHLLDLKV